jgi:cyclophilin family peptidyl-prolyl cis-trans isomerase
MHFHNPRFNPDETAIARARRLSSLAQGLGEIAALKPEKDPSRVNDVRSMAEVSLASWLCVFPESRTRKCLESSWLRPPEVFRAYAAFKPRNLAEVLRQQLRENDVIIRATAAELLGELPPDDTNARALIEALPVALRDKDLNDAALSILDALAKQKSAAANDAIKTALDSSDHLIRRRAIELLKANGVGDFSDRIGTVRTRNTAADYRRAIARIGRKVTATVVTSKGAFTIEFLTEEAPLTVDNFVQLARKRYFNGQTVPRVVPNFVIQTGDPRGDQNGGPGYQIRCEINEVPYERGAVGMALSGKDTGGSQWFVTHSPQPHLDGGYTVFGRVIRGMDVVDNIARGDTILRVIVNER